jgi:DNA replication and repair protein RecF
MQNLLSGLWQFQLKLDMPASGRSQVWVNGVKKQRQLELSECLRCVLFSPEDLYLIKGPASGRRDFLDGAISQIRPRYGDLLARYEKLLDSKSRLLKMEEPRPSAELIAAYDDQLAHIGAHLMGYRAKFCRGLGEECGNMHAAISGGKETLTLQYKTVSTVTDPFSEPSVIEGQLRDHLESHRLAELQSGSCLSGLHKDDVELFLNGRPAKAFASQGQTRSAALALKFGQRELFFRDTGEYPVLLLDDVLSELDAPRQAFVATHAMGGQSIITCCEERQEFQNSNLILL